MQTSSVVLARAPNRRRTAIPVICFVAALIFGAAVDQFLAGGHQLDQMLLFGLPGPFDGADISKRTAHLAHTLSALGSPELVGLLATAAAGFLALAGRLRGAAFVLCSVAGGGAAGFALKIAFGAVRPHSVPGPGDVAPSTSFPSGHALLATLLYVALAAVLAECLPAERRRVLKLYAFVVAGVLTVAVGISRVLLAVHWPSDVIAGVAAGGTWVAFCWTCIGTDVRRDPGVLPHRSPVTRRWRR